MEEFKNIQIIGESKEEAEIVDNLNIQKYESLNSDNTKEEQIQDTSKIESDNNIIKDFNYYLTRMKTFAINIQACYGFYLLYSYYYLSLEKCYDGEDGCIKKLEWIMQKVKEEVISVIFGALLLQLIIIKIISKIHLIHFISMFIYFFRYSHGLVFDDHGYFNILYFFILLGIITLILLPLDLILCCVKRKNYIKVIIDYFIILSIIGYFNYDLFRYSSDCYDWDRGLNNTSIDNDKSKYGCQIQIPKVCAYKVVEFTQDYSKLKGKDCKKQNDGNEEKKKFLKVSTSPYINDKTKSIGYPLFNKEPMCFKDFPDNNNIIFKYVYANLFDMENEEIVNKYFKDSKPELEIDFTNIDEPKLILNVQYNKTLSEERKKLEKKTKPYSNNILILYVDSVSRVNGLRQLKKTVKFFEQFMSYKGHAHKKYPNEVFHSFQFFKYYSFRGYTTINFPFLFYGINRKFRSKKLITKYYKENRFIASAANDWCNIDNIRTLHTFNTDNIYDHLLLLCDPNNDQFSLNTIRCLYGKHNTEHLIEYTDQFWRKYKDNRKYSIIIDNHGHEGTLTVLKYVDDCFSKFLNDLFKDNLLKDTTVFLLADHGVGMPSVYYTMDFYQIEINLPILLILVNDRKNTSYEKQYKYMHQNQQTLITAFDIYNTFGNIIYGDKYKSIKKNSKKRHTCKSGYGGSLFDDLKPKTRKPSIYSSIARIINKSCK